jgi:hypothetical protein
MEKTLYRTTAIKSTDRHKTAIRQQQRQYAWVSRTESGDAGVELQALAWFPVGLSIPERGKKEWLTLRQPFQDSIAFGPEETKFDQLFVVYIPAESWRTPLTAGAACQARYSPSSSSLFWATTASTM